MLCFYLNATAEYLKKVGYDVVFEYFVVISLKAVKNFSSDGDNCLKFRISSQFARAESRVAFDYINFSFCDIL